MPLMDGTPGPALPIDQPADSAPPLDSAPGSEVILSDVIGSDRMINIFASLCRDIEPVSVRLENGQVNTTVLAPLNSAIEALPRKPWEDPEEYDKLGDQAYEGDDGPERANRNLKRFVEAHLVSTKEWPEGKNMETLGGTTVWWEMKDGKRVLMPGDIEVTSVGRTVGNGAVWVLKKVRNYASN